MKRLTVEIIANVEKNVDAVIRYVSADGLGNDIVLKKVMAFFFKKLETDEEYRERFFEF